ncbi:dephospho-CoA kinase domain-containing protein [Strongylocentrotus purpuratus]|uniref:Dephospho-CoA kinase domain-containing protein n=1 Tax=Strongylocentrotus purpuratus TaxID=7668 RepID=A0A7M7TGE6_STRPU|nr:dephospho-CoA kinase domain-containing protein [Strongylocentrotus purpuratus]
MFLVGLTGGIASGKSTVSNVLRDLGCVIIDADKIAREVVEPGKPALKRIVRHFGKSVLQDDGTLDRAKLGSIIFADSEKRKILNRCTHPYIQRTMLWEVLTSFLSGHHYVILDVPLLLDGSALRSFIKYVLVVYCDEATQLDRLMARNDLTQEGALQRINSQVPLEIKKKQADFVIDNNGSLTATKQQVLELYERLEGSYAHWKLRSFLFGSLVLLGGVAYQLYSFL